MKYMIQLVAFVIIFAGCSGGGSSDSGNGKVNTPPVAISQFVVVEMNTTKTIILQGTDVDGDSLTYAIDTSPLQGTVSLTGATAVYIPNDNYTGIDSFTFTVNDGKVDSAPATVGITVSTVPAVINTGQTTSYADYDDGWYSSGTGTGTPTGTDRDYTRGDDNVTVTDNVTNLMWEDDNTTETVQKPWVTKANYDLGKYGDTSGDTAATYCAELTLGGYDDWRLPSRAELVTISNFGKVNPGVDPEFLNTIEAATATDYNKSYWSATTRIDSPKFAWNIYSYYGGLYGSGDKQQSFYVRCVRTLP